MKEYPCRTEEISGISYSISIWSNADNEGPSGYMSPYESYEKAEESAVRMMRELPNGKYEINTHPWKRKVCIECGEETF